jgi:hypothetical protein
LPVAVQEAIQSVQVGLQDESRGVGAGVVDLTDVVDPADNQPNILRQNWACKKYQSHVKLTDEVSNEIERMLMLGINNREGERNSIVGRVVQEMREEGGMLARQWDQRVVCRVKNVKSLFNR